MTPVKELIAKMKKLQATYRYFMKSGTYWSNVYVILLFLDISGKKRTHNIKIHRTYFTFNVFIRKLERKGVLDPDSETDLFCLHPVYLPLINQFIKEFVNM